MSKKEIEYYSEGDIKKAAEGAGSVSEVMGRLGISAAGANHRIFKKRLIDLGIQLNGKVKYNCYSGLKIKRTVYDYLKKNGPKISSNKLRKMLFKEGLKIPVCEWCGLGGVWNGRSLTHHLDHSDGDYYNNEIDNLRILCPNCHSQTETYCKGGERKKAKRFRSTNNVERICQCGNRVNCPGQWCCECRKMKVEEHVLNVLETRGVGKADFVLCFNNNGITRAADLIGVPGATLNRWIADGLFSDGIQMREREEWSLESKGVTLEFLELEVDKWGYAEVGRSLGVHGTTIKNWIEREKNCG